MEALLFVFIFYVSESTHSIVTPMPNMQKCEAAAAKIRDAVLSKPMGTRYAITVCVNG